MPVLAQRWCRLGVRACFRVVTQGNCLCWWIIMQNNHALHLISPLPGTSSLYALSSHNQLSFIIIFTFAVILEKPLDTTLKKLLFWKFSYFSSKIQQHMSIWGAMRSGSLMEEQRILWCRQAVACSAYSLMQAGGRMQCTSPECQGALSAGRS